MKGQQSILEVLNTIWRFTGEKNIQRRISAQDKKWNFIKFILGWRIFWGFTDRHLQLLFERENVKFSVDFSLFFMWLWVDFVLSLTYITQENDAGVYHSPLNGAHVPCIVISIGFSPTLSNKGHANISMFTNVNIHFQRTGMCLLHTLPLYLHIHGALMTKVRQFSSAVSTYMVCKWVQLCHMCALVVTRAHRCSALFLNRCSRPTTASICSSNTREKLLREQHDIIQEHFPLVSLISDFCNKISHVLINNYTTY